MTSVLVASFHLLKRTAEKQVEGDTIGRRSYFSSYEQEMRNNSISLLVDDSLDNKSGLDCASCLVFLQQNCCENHGKPVFIALICVVLASSIHCVPFTSSVQVPMNDSLV